ncbi:MAG: 30S ribosomal protein S1 [Deltaproteobacteria bacterium]|nr:30S ribosomal protein S1 [Deltaproteobacteria bacterium]
MVEEKDNQDSQAEESFEELLNKTEIRPIYFKPGEKVSAVVSKIDREWVFIDLGGKKEGSIAANEFSDENGEMTIKEGEMVTAYFLSSRNNEMLFATKLSDETTGGRYLEEAYHSRIPVEGLVVKEIKGGYEVKISGHVKAFCPYSLMGAQRDAENEQYIGQRMTFKVIEYGEKGRNIILSNKAVIEEERTKQRELLRERIEEGMTITGEVTSIKRFGAFVDIGGIEGLIPLSELSWGRINDASNILHEGQKLDVVITKLDWENDKFTFSLKDALPDPWEDINDKYPEGSVHRGRVSRLAKFGAFVTLEPGIDGLIHISELGKGKRINHPREIIEEDQEIDVIIQKADEKGRRLSLQLANTDQDDEISDYKNHIAKTRGDSSGSFGTLGDLLNARLKNKK